MPTKLAVRPSDRESFCRTYEDAICVAAPLEAIMRFENRPVGAVVLAGEYAENPELAHMLGELFPSLHIERG